MQRLLSLRLLSKNPRNSSYTSSSLRSVSSESLLSLSKANPFHLHNSQVHQPYNLFSHYATCSHSWRPQNNLPGQIHRFLLNPVLAKQFLTNRLAKGPTKGLVDLRVASLRAQFPRRSFHYGRLVQSYRRGWQSWLGRLTTDGVVLGLILTNVAVFLLWKIANRNFMSKNFTISLDNFKSGRAHTLITSAFSHIEADHLIFNMIGLYFFGTHIGRFLGPERLLMLYISGAVVGSVFYLVHHAFMSQSSKSNRMWDTDPSRTPGLGASGAVNAIMLLDIFLFPKSTLYFEYIIPVPAILLGIFLIGKDVLRIIEGDSQISGSAHLGGAVVAAIAWARIKRGRF